MTNDRTPNAFFFEYRSFSYDFTSKPYATKEKAIAAARKWSERDNEADTRVTKRMVSFYRNNERGNHEGRLDFGPEFKQPEVRIIPVGFPY